jgi:hypothetical protein
MDRLVHFAKEHPLEAFLIAGIVIVLFLMYEFRKSGR